MAKKHPKQLWIAFLIVVIIILLQNTVIFLEKPEMTARAVSNSGNISLCISTPPIIDISACQDRAFIFYNYSCQVQATDSQHIVFNYALRKLAGPIAGNPLFVLNGSRLNFTPIPSQRGNYSIEFSVDDDSHCGAPTRKLFNLSIDFSSGAPYLVKPIPNQTWDENVMLFPFNLNEYFADPTNDLLAFSAYNNINIKIDILASGSSSGATGDVLLTPAVDWCGNETVYFRATDPTNLSADSNPVNLEVKCVTTPPPPPPSSTDAGTASSGGGGGGIGNPSGCTPSFSCFDWSECQLTRAVNPNTGNSQTIDITGPFGSRTFTVDENYSNDPSVFYQGYMYKECVDTRQCDSQRVTSYVRNCTWKPSCTDGLQNQGESGVDCGGPCAPCSSCTDGIQNGQEVGVDCGGSVCPVCNTCTNGKMDGKETGLDCGGPDCLACDSCFDGVQNRDETGVDCGGKYCRSCSELQAPAVVIPWLTIILIVLILVVLIALFFTAINRHIMALLMKFFFKYKKKNRKIIISTNLKEEILKRLAALEAAVESQPMLKSQEQLASIIRDYFKEALKLDFEFTNEELIVALQKNKLDAVLSKVLQQFFTRISVIEFSGVAVEPVVLKALVQETRSLVYQTAVLTVDDLREREKDLTLNELPKDASEFDRSYLLLTQAHLCLQFDKIELAAALYQVLNDWYATASTVDKVAIYPDLERLYNEYVLATKKL